MAITYRTSDIIRHVALSMWHRKLAIGLSVVGVAIAIATVFANSQLSMSMYENAQARLDPLALRRVVLTVNEARQSAGFSKTRLAEFQSDGRIETAVPLYEVQVTVANQRTRRSALGVMESASQDDPAFAASRIIAGRGLRDDPDEVVLAESIANQLGISTPRERVSIRLERSRDGVPQVEERSLSVAGIVRGADRVYASTDTARSLDLWVSHVTRYVGEEQNTGPVEYPSALLWTRQDASKAMKLAARMGVELKFVRKDTIPRLGPDSWFRPHPRGKCSAVPGIQTYPVYTARGRKGPLVALVPDDPRWAAFGKPADDRVTVPRDESEIRGLLGERIMGSVVGFTTPTGLALETLDLEARCQRATWIATSHPKALEVLAALPKALIPNPLPAVAGELAFAPKMTPEERMDAMIELPDGIDIQFRTADPAGYVLTGSADMMRHCVAALAGQGRFHTYAFRQRVHILVPRVLDRVTRRALDGLSDVVSASVPYLRSIESGSTVLTVPAKSLRKLGGGSAVPAIRTRTSHSRDGEAYPCGVVVMSDNAWRREAARQMASSALRPAEWHVRVTNAEMWSAIRGLGVRLDALDPSSTETFDVYRATRPDGKAMGEDILSALRMARPTFLRARGETTVDIPVSKGKVIRAEAMQPDDLERFSMIRGHWLNDEKSLVVAESDLSSLRLGKTDCIGKSIEFRWVRKDAFGRDERLDIPLKIVGIAEHTAMHAGLAWSVRQWTRGEVNLVDGEFRTPMEQEAAYGARRVKLVAVSPDDVMAIARRFEGQGFLVSHQVDKQRALAGLATALRNLTFLLCGAAVLLSALVVVTSVYLFYDARRGEIASLRSLGVRRMHIVKSFFIEAVFFGLLSFLAGVLLFVVASPGYADLVSKAFGIDQGVLRIGICGPYGPLLLLGSLGLALVYSLVAQALPICVAVRRSILGALRG